jgi:hypothetical protein
MLSTRNAEQRQSDSSGSSEELFQLKGMLRNGQGKHGARPQGLLPLTHWFQRMPSDGYRF